jgi:hypothetical protein
VSAVMNLQVRKNVGISLLADNPLTSHEEQNTIEIVTSLVSKFCYKLL